MLRVRWNYKNFAVHTQSTVISFKELPVGSKIGSEMMCTERSSIDVALISKTR